MNFHVSTKKLIKQGDVLHPKKKHQFGVSCSWPILAATSHLDAPAAGLLSHLRLATTIVQQKPTSSPTLGCVLGTNNPTLPFWVLCGVVFIAMYLGQVLLF